MRHFGIPVAIAADPGSVSDEFGVQRAWCITVHGFDRIAHIAGQAGHSFPDGVSEEEQAISGLIGDGEAACSHVVAQKQERDACSEAAFQVVALTGCEAGVSESLGEVCDLDLLGDDGLTACFGGVCGQGRADFDAT